MTEKYLINKTQSNTSVNLRQNRFSLNYEDRQPSFVMFERVTSSTKNNVLENFEKMSLFVSTYSDDSNNRMDIDTSVENNLEELKRPKLEKNNRCSTPFSINSTNQFDCFSPKIVSSPLKSPLCLPQVAYQPESMEIDPSLSNASSIKENVSENLENSLKVEDNLIHQVPIKKKRKNSLFSVIFKVLIPLNLLVIALLIQYTNQPNLKDIFNLTSLETDLRTNLYGQEAAIDLLTETLQNINGSQTIFIMGNSGVGKTHMMNILIRHFLFSNIFNFFSVFDDQRNFVNYLSRNEYNLIIFDSLKVNQLQIIQSLLNLDLKRFKTIIFFVITTPTNRKTNVHETELESSINNNLNESKLNEIIDRSNSTVIKMNELNITTVKKCIIQSMEKRDIKVTDSKIQTIMEYLNNFISTGCKRVDKKVALLNKKNVQ